MIEKGDPLRISQTALTRAGGFGLARALDKREGENLAGLLKYMVENSAIATGRKRNPHRARANRRRYGDFILVLKGSVLVDIAVERHDWCQNCLGVHRGTPSCDCN
ncbi:MAG TPA: hypothetical protein VGD46_13375 [Rhizobacter sp.]